MYFKRWKIFTAQPLNRLKYTDPTLCVRNIAHHTKSEHANTPALCKVCSFCITRIFWQSFRRQLFKTLHLPYTRSSTSLSWYMWICTFTSFFSHFKTSLFQFPFKTFKRGRLVYMGNKNRKQSKKSMTTISSEEVGNYFCLNITTLFLRGPG